MTLAVIMALQYVNTLVKSFAVLPDGSFKIILLYIPKYLKQKSEDSF